MNIYLANVKIYHNKQKRIITLKSMYFTVKDNQPYLNRFYLQKFDCIFLYIVPLLHINKLTYSGCDNLYSTLATLCTSIQRPHMIGWTIWPITNCHTRRLPRHEILIKTTTELVYLLRYLHYLLIDVCNVKWCVFILYQVVFYKCSDTGISRKPLSLKVFYLFHNCFV